MNSKKIQQPTYSSITDNPATKDDSDISSRDNIRHTEESTNDNNEITPIDNYDIANINNKAPQNFDSFIQYVDKEIKKNVYLAKKYSNRYKNYEETRMLSIAKFLIGCLFPNMKNWSDPGFIWLLGLIVLWLVAAIVLPIIAGVFALGHIITKSIVQKVSDYKNQQSLMNIEIYKFLKNKLTDILPDQDNIDYKELYKSMELTLKNQVSNSKKQISRLSAQIDDFFTDTNIDKIGRKMFELRAYSDTEIEEMEKTIADIKNRHESIKTLPFEITSEEYRKAINPKQDYKNSTANHIQNLQKDILLVESKIQDILQSPFREQSEEYKPTVERLKDMKKARKALLSKLKDEDSKLKDEDKQLIKLYQLKIKNAKKRKNYEKQLEALYKKQKSEDTPEKKISDLFEILEKNIVNEKNKQIINDAKKSLFSNQEDNKKFISSIIDIFYADVSRNKCMQFDNYASAIASALQRVSQADSLPDQEE